MCFYNSINKGTKILSQRYNKQSDLIENYTEAYVINGFDNPLFPIITISTEVKLFNWGLIPSWTKTAMDASQIRKLTLNAKSETVFEKPSFKNSIYTQRCIVPSTGFFEWKHERGQIVPYFIKIASQEIFSLAGLYDVWIDKSTGEIFNTFTILTTIANSLMENIHNTKKRMPVILTVDGEKQWLNANLSKTDILSLLAPFNEKDMTAYTIDPNFLKKSPFNCKIIEPFNKQPSTGFLF